MCFCIEREVFFLQAPDTGESALRGQGLQERVLALLQEMQSHGGNSVSCQAPSPVSYLPQNEHRASGNGEFAPDLDTPTYLRPSPRLAAKHRCVLVCVLASKNPSYIHILMSPQSSTRFPFPLRKLVSLRPIQSRWICYTDGRCVSSRSALVIRCLSIAAMTSCHRMSMSNDLKKT